MESRCCYCAWLLTKLCHTKRNRILIHFINFTCVSLRFHVDMAGVKKKVCWRWVREERVNSRTVTPGLISSTDTLGLCMSVLLSKKTLWSSASPRDTHLALVVVLFVLLHHTALHPHTPPLTHALTHEFIIRNQVLALCLLVSSPFQAKSCGPNTEVKCVSDQLLAAGSLLNCSMLICLNPSVIFTLLLLPVLEVLLSVGWGVFWVHRCIMLLLYAIISKVEVALSKYIF